LKYLRLYDIGSQRYRDYKIRVCGKNSFPLLQKGAIIDNAKTASDTDPLIFKYKILNLNGLTKFNRETFMYRYTKNLLPYSFNDNFKKLGNLERFLNYQIDILNTGSLEYLPSYALLKIWNKLPLDLKRSASLGIF